MSKQELQTYCIVYSHSEAKVNNYMKDFRAVSFNQLQSFPVALKHKAMVEIGLETAVETEMSSVKKGWNAENVVDLIKFLHGSTIAK